MAQIPNAKLRTPVTPNAARGDAAATGYDALQLSQTQPHLPMGRQCADGGRATLFGQRVYRATVSGTDVPAQLDAYDCGHRQPDSGPTQRRELAREKYEVKKERSQRIDQQKQDHGRPESEVPPPKNQSEECCHQQPEREGAEEPGKPVRFCPLIQDRIARRPEEADGHQNGVDNYPAWGVHSHVTTAHQRGRPHRERYSDARSLCYRVRHTGSQARRARPKRRRCTGRWTQTRSP
jgi:hypothetical protein